MLVRPKMRHLFVLLTGKFVLTLLPTLCWAGTPCLYGVDGICVPKRNSYGFHQPKWRRWPATAATSEATERAQERIQDVPPGEVPDEMEEGDLSPAVPTGSPDTDGRKDIRASDQPSQFDQDFREDPFLDDPLQPEDGAARQQRAGVERTLFSSHRVGKRGPKPLAVMFGEFALTRPYLPQQAVHRYPTNADNSTTAEVPATLEMSKTADIRTTAGFPTREEMPTKARIQTLSASTPLRVGPPSQAAPRRANPLRQAAPTAAPAVQLPLRTAVPVELARYRPSSSRTNSTSRFNPLRP